MFKFFMKCFVMSAFLFVTACSSNFDHDVSSEEKANIQPKFSFKTAEQVKHENDLVEQHLLNEYQLVKTISMQVDSSKIYDESMQPKNKKQKCLVPFLVAQDNEDVDVYWEGDCFKGYAVGLGRLVLLKHGQKQSESLLELDKQKRNKSNAYLYIPHEKEETLFDVEFGLTSLSVDKGHVVGFSATLGFNPVEWQQKNYNLKYRYEDTFNLVSFHKTINLVNGEKLSFIAYPNFSKEVLSLEESSVNTFVQKSYRILEGTKNVGYSFILQKDGSLILRAGEENFKLNSKIKPLLDEMEQVEKVVDQKISNIDANVDLGLAKIYEYTKLKCQRPQPLFKDDKQNSVCNFLLELQRNQDDLTKYQQAQVKQQKSKAQHLQQQKAVLDSLKRSLRGL